MVLGAWAIGAGWLVTATALASDEPASVVGRSSADVAIVPKRCRRITARGAGLPGRRINLWERARVPNLLRYCDMIGLAYAQVGERSDAALAIADVAQMLVENPAEAWIVRGLVASRAGAYAAAVKHFEKARSLEASSLAPAPIMIAYATALMKTGHLAQALVSAKAAVARLHEFPSVQSRALALLTAASLALAAFQTASAAPSAAARNARVGLLQQAFGFLHEARRLALSVHQSHIQAMLLLALHYDNQREGVKVLASDMAQKGRREQLLSTDKASLVFLAEPSQWDQVKQLLTQAAPLASTPASTPALTPSSPGKGRRRVD